MSSSSSSLRCSAAPHSVSCVRPLERRVRRRGPRSDSSFLRRFAERHWRFSQNSRQPDFSRSLSPDFSRILTSTHPPPTRPSFYQRTLHEFFRRSEPPNSNLLPPDGGCGDSQPSPSVDASDLTIFYANIRSFNANNGELSARLSLFASPPHVVCLSETWLNQAVREPSLSGYTLLARNDSDFQSGGVAIFVIDFLVPACSRLLVSSSAELVWIMVHCNSGPVLLGCMYRRPRYGEVASIDILQSEWLSLQEQSVGTIIVGDFNAHHIGWLRHSHSTTPEGSRLKRFSQEHGLSQRVKSPTRGPYLLDLVLTDLPNLLTVEVISEITDHRALSLRFSAPPISFESLPRKVWVFSQANWHLLKARLRDQSWTWIQNSSPDVAAKLLTDIILHYMNESIPSASSSSRSSHPWLTAECVHLVEQKMLAAGT